MMKRAEVFVVQIGFAISLLFNSQLPTACFRLVAIDLRFFYCLNNLTVIINNTYYCQNYI